MADTQSRATKHVAYLHFAMMEVRKNVVLTPELVEFMTRECMCMQVAIWPHGFMEVYF